MAKGKESRLDRATKSDLGRLGRGLGSASIYAHGEKRIPYRCAARNDKRQGAGSILSSYCDCSTSSITTLPPLLAVTTLLTGAYPESVISTS